MIDKIRGLVTADKLEMALDELVLLTRGRNDDLTNEVIGHQAGLNKLKKDSRRGLITSEEENRGRNKIRFAILEMLKDLASEAPSEIADTPADRVPTIFISYNHADSAVAEQIRLALVNDGLDVRIDHAVMDAGANIQKFIEDSIRDTDVTLSIVSNRSLRSAWVAMESIDTFHQQKFQKDKKFIACYIDDDFFQEGFRLDATRHIDAQIQEIDKLIPEYIAQKIDTNDLNDQKSRLFKLRNNLGDILQRLRSSLCIDVRGDKMGDGIAKIILAIRK